MTASSRYLALVARAGVLIAILCTTTSAWAVPAFARKYGTSCTTCHTIFPKLTAFGESFRRNGYRFPGVDSDFVKAEPVVLGQPVSKDMFPNTVWPGTLPPAVPLAFGMNGSAVVHPDKHAGATAGANGARFSLDDLVGEAHLWAAGSFDDDITFFSEVTFSADGVEVEHGTVHFNDLVGPAHLVNVTIGKAMATVSSFGPHSTYLADRAMLAAPVTGLLGATSPSFTLVDNHNQVEVGGTAGGRFAYGVGLSAGTDADLANSQDLHAYVGYKLGGMRLDGEHPVAMADASEHEHSVDEEHSITADAFAVRSVSHVVDAASAAQVDTALILGGAIHAQWAEVELTAGVYAQRDDHAQEGGAKAQAVAQWNELSYAAYPWLVMAVRTDYLRLMPDGGPAVTDLRVMPGVAALVRPNLKFTLTAPIEHASGAPVAGWAAAEPLASSGAGTELEAIELALFCAF